MALPPFQRLLDDHGRAVHRFLVATVGPLDADDCYQETWLSALRAYPRLRDASNLRSWVFTVAHRKAIDHIRARRRAPVTVGGAGEALATVALARTAGLGHTAKPGHTAGLAATAAVGVPQDEDLWAAVRALPPKQRTAVALRFLADLAYADIGAAMGTSEEAARRNVHEGLKRLRDDYDHE